MAGVLRRHWGEAWSRARSMGDRSLGGGMVVEQKALAQCVDVLSVAVRSWRTSDHAGLAAVWMVCTLASRRAEVG
jgi:hypothetical protein